MDCRLLWGGVAGAKMHGLLHGEDIVSARHARSSISHQHVLAPDDRTADAASPVMRQLLVRAAQRLRNDCFYCRPMIVDVRWLGCDRDGWTESRSFAETQDTGALLHVLEDIWKRVPNLKPCLHLPFTVSTLSN